MTTQEDMYNQGIKRQNALGILIVPVVNVLRNNKHCCRSGIFNLRNYHQNSLMQVVPGSVADGSLSSGDLILKIGNHNVTNAYHSEGQDHIKNAGNTLQLTIKK